MESMRQHSPNLVEQADTVSQELIRVAVLWHELWHEGLEEASRLYETPYFYFIVHIFTRWANCMKVLW